MLAITHHLLVQVAASRCVLMGTKLYSKGWFIGYELLGDDIVIFDPQVAEQYLLLMSSLGVGINLSKSVVSTPPAGRPVVVEFAKRTGYCRNIIKGPAIQTVVDDVSALS